MIRIRRSCSKPHAHQKTRQSFAVEVPVSPGSARKIASAGEVAELNVAQSAQLGTTLLRSRTRAPARTPKPAAPRDAAAFLEAEQLAIDIRRLALAHAPHVDPNQSQTKTCWVARTTHSRRCHAVPRHRSDHDVRSRLRALSGSAAHRELTQTQRRRGAAVSAVTIATPGQVREVMST